ncbi:MAG: hypothetical protein GC159_14015 [Phycisphaera sp.]|nr:hypothetical protein [Phycisphaera sp.]
MPRPAPSCMRR